MQGNGFKIGLIVAFLGLTLFYLYPTVIYNLEQKQISELSSTDSTQYVDEHREKLASLKERTLNLGLDLQGGMYVMLEVGTPQLILELAGENKDSELEQVVASARAVALENDTDFIDEMATEFQSQGEGARLSRYFRNDAAEITRRSTNEEIITFLKAQRTEALDRAIEIIRTRVDRFGVTEPSIVKQGTDRIVVELPGVDDKERVRNLLKGTARLEFRLAANANDFSSFINQVYDYFDEKAAGDEGDSLDTIQPNALLEVLIPSQGSPYVLGYAEEQDTAEVNALLKDPEIDRMLPRNTTIMWSANTQANPQGVTEVFTLYGVKTDVEMTGDVIEEASVQFDPTTNVPEVSMTMNAEGARDWARITGANIGKPVAIVLDGFIYTYPNVISKISNGRSSITGVENVGEADDLVNILLSGALPAPLEIVEERTVGASLGQASIDASLNSVLIGLSIVAIFMIVYYRTGGAVADLALLLNIVFILGILAGFKATLTLPGMAGIVLTIGMAVDANVLIFDRIREEQRTGKTIKAAISAGYANAMSAIFDANITTGFVALVLLSFGVGPIKGFAVTLLAGICCSLFSAIIITRVVVDYLTRAKSDAVNFG
ncbi:protein-export membrane protein SecD [Balneola sp. EhC07]|uniref:protein translocase subunit SecD n=2 Tax=Pseudomonadati TaxID=3379134 RepID=UPI0007F46613|nr:protein translocase subunit SecD [Balneola sp. EhC07]OAN60447.1 protein-export membrane protein SecD [Balneola sp. EhC07]